ncbi:Bifunctional PGK/TIM [Fundidesulfovibrio magnetotacticus]|uniref:Triosephosphate isomerase n=1 Tax=Fundidesulfovibrio magnetotacticus TaxID=2730080 RepID=A0A6V8LTR7_9BACT|nr:triose-phosphate isomerase [Fundidesulfovibrio magnetotacticus]GFK94330.1 Bifunctional PGK/TIM [Fundidesulfovibrio magnetotacticus]
MKKLMAGNWKMYKLKDEAKETASALVKLLDGAAPEGREVLLIPPFTALRGVRKALKKAKGFALGAQNFYPSAQGAFTGEIAPEMLLDAGCAYALAGHSERRHILGESDAFVGEKVAFGLEKGLSMILCVGETLEERNAGRLEEVVRRQMEAGLAGVAPGVAPERLTVAYEPVWAIGTGLTAGPREILDAHALVRGVLAEKFAASAASMRILYGGSVKPENANEIILLDNVDGVLVGGSSLSAESFAKIAAA